MKKFRLFYFVLALILADLNADAQQNDTQTTQLKQLISQTVNKKCHLTTLPRDKDLSSKNGNVTVNLIFSNSSLKEAWSPEVAVAYIYSASLSPLLGVIWPRTNKKYNRIKAITFKVEIMPHDIPPFLDFEVSQQNWRAHQTNRDLEKFYKRIKVTAGGKPFKFNAHEAVGIE